LFVLFVPDHALDKPLQSGSSWGLEAENRSPHQVQNQDFGYAALSINPWRHAQACERLWEHLSKARIRAKVGQNCEEMAVTELKAGTKNLKLETAGLEKGLQVTRLTVWRKGYK